MNRLPFRLVSILVLLASTAPASADDAADWTAELVRLTHRQLCGDPPARSETEKLGARGYRIFGDGVMAEFDRVTRSVVIGWSTDSLEANRETCRRLKH